MERADVEVIELAPAATHPLRRSVLRDGTPSDVVVFDGDELPTTFHLGARMGEHVIAVSTWVHREYPARPGIDAVQLRGMATAPAVRGTGVGTKLLRAGVERARGDGRALVWARARVTALAFYERAGFAVVGEPYVDATTGLPHRDIVLPLDSGG